jgi:hypothetical protein
VRVLRKFGEGYCIRCRERVHYEQFQHYVVDAIYPDDGRGTLYIHRKCWWKIVLDWQADLEVMPPQPAKKPNKRRTKRRGKSGGNNP